VRTYRENVTAWLVFLLFGFNVAIAQPGGPGIDNPPDLTALEPETIDVSGSIFNSAGAVFIDDGLALSGFLFNLSTNTVSINDDLSLLGNDLLQVDGLSMINGNIAASDGIVNINDTLQMAAGQDIRSADTLLVLNDDVRLVGSLFLDSGESIESSGAQLTINDPLTVVGLGTFAAGIDMADGTITDSADDNVTVDDNLTVTGDLIVVGGFQGGAFGGYVDAAGTAENVPTTWSAESTGTGTYTVTHSRSLSAGTDMAVTCVAITSGGQANCAIASAGTDSFNVETVVSDSPANAAFFFTAVDIVN
jgi:hypothetical protein